MSLFNLAMIANDPLQYLIGQKPHESVLAPLDLLSVQDSKEDPWNKSEELSCIFSEHSGNINERHDGNPISWSNLPSPAVENILSFLSREDRYQMSLVCRRWSNEYKSPSLWRNVDFYVKSSKRPCFEIAYAWKYGHLFRHVRIIYCEPDEEESVDCKERLINFLWALACRSRLLSISLINKSYFSTFRFFDTSSGMFHNILELLKSQNTLRSMEIHDTYAAKSELTHILQTAFSSNAETLKKLKITFFSCYSVLDKTSLNDPNLDLSFIHSLLNLDVFEADYTRFFEILISELLKHAHEMGPELWKNAKLKRIKLLCDRNVFNRYSYGCSGISTTAWMHLKKICPVVDIDLSMISLDLFCDNLISFVIVPGIPLRSLKLNLKLCTIDTEQNIDFLIQHLMSSGSNKYLEEIDISLPHCYVISFSGLVEFLLTCSKLRIVKLKVPWPVFRLDNILECLLLNAPKTLEAVSIIITHRNDLECLFYCQTLKEYFKSSYRMSNVFLSISEDTVYCRKSD